MPLESVHATPTLGKQIRETSKTNILKRSSTGGFGQPAANTGGFGAAKPFGAPATTGGGLFGNTTATAGGGFGGGFGQPPAQTTGFGAPAAAGGLFGAKPATTGFGATAGTGLFGGGGGATTGTGFGAAANPATPAFGQTAAGGLQNPPNGTSNPAFEPYVEKDVATNAMNHFQTIAFMPAYQKFSLEVSRVSNETHLRNVS